MSRFKFTQQAQKDLIQIRRFTLEHWGLDQSMHYLDEMKKTLLLVSEMPLMGKSCMYDLGRDVYRFPFGSHIIYYLKLSDDEILIFAILHQNMVPEKHLKNRL